MKKTELRREWKRQIQQTGTGNIWFGDYGGRQFFNNEKFAYPSTCYLFHIKYEDTEVEHKKL